MNGNNNSVSNSEEIKKNLNYRLGLPYPSNLYVIIPPILTLIGLACFLIYLSQWLVVKTFSNFVRITSGTYVFDLETTGLVTDLVQIAQLILAIILLVKAFRSIRFQSIADKHYDLLINRGIQRDGTVRKIQQHGKRVELEYIVILDEKQVTCKYITYSPNTVKTGDIVHVLWYDQKINAPLL